MVFNSNIQRSLTIPFRMVFLMWLAYYIQSEGGFDFGFLGILPRTLKGLVGLVTGPMIHGTLNHLVGNTFPLIVLGGLLFWYYPRVAQRVFWQCYFFTGILVWVFARSFYHIGSSGLVYALGFFLVVQGLLRRDLRTLLVSFIVIALYGGLFSRVWVLDSRISWESHVMGAVVGVATAIFFSYIYKSKYQ